MRAGFLFALASLAWLTACNPAVRGLCVTAQDCAPELTCQQGLCVKPAAPTPADGGALDSGIQPLTDAGDDAGLMPPPDAGEDAGQPPVDAGLPPPDAGMDAGQPACQGNQDCPALQACQNGICVQKGCDNDTDCSFDGHFPRCNVTTHACVACLMDGHCSTGLVCTQNTCVPSNLGPPCPGSGFCGLGSVCVQGARTTCQATCNLSAAMPSCDGGDLCGIGSVNFGFVTSGACLPSNGLAQDGESCSISNDCDVNLACTKGFCRRLCDPNRSTNACALPSGCVATSAYGAGQTVNFGGCVPPPPQCQNSADCSSSEVCAATASSAAPSGLANECVPRVGKTAPGDFCGKNSDCQSGQCIGTPAESAPHGTNGSCEGGCTQDSDCAAPSGELASACELVGVPWTDALGAKHTATLASCTAQCYSETDCGGSTSCFSVENVEGSAWVTRCEPIQYANLKKLGGADCFTDAECTTGACHHFQGSIGGICVGVCDPQNGTQDCSQQKTAACPQEGVLLPLANGTQAVAHICWGAACQQDSDCGFGHACGSDPDPTNPTQRLKHCRPR